MFPMDLLLGALNLAIRIGRDKIKVLKSYAVCDQEFETRCWFFEGKDCFV